MFFDKESLGSFLSDIFYFKSLPRKRTILIMPYLKLLFIFIYMYYMLNKIHTYEVFQYYERVPGETTLTVSLVSGPKT